MRDDAAGIRDNIAATAAGLIADGGLDYASAKRKAARQVLGENNPARNMLPDNDRIDVALREHLDLFDDDHGERIERRRSAALELMELLQQFNILLTGAVWKGIVTEHAPIHLQAFDDNSKELMMILLNRGIRFDSVTVPHIKGSGETEAMTFYWRNEPVILSTYNAREYRTRRRETNPNHNERGDRAALLARISL